MVADTTLLEAHLCHVSFPASLVIHASFGFLAMKQQLLLLALDAPGPASVPLAILQEWPLKSWNLPEIQLKLIMQCYTCGKRMKSSTVNMFFGRTR